VCSQEGWLTNTDSTSVGTVFAPFITEDDISPEDAPFELDRPGSEALTVKPEARLDNLNCDYSSLTLAEEQDLQNIAMPYLLSKIKICNSTSLATLPSLLPNSPSPKPTPATRPRKNKERKSIIDNDGASRARCQSQKNGHNAIEKRYRTNLNVKIDCLRLGIPSLCAPTSSDSKSDDKAEDSDSDHISGKSRDPKYGKAAILTRALEYIKHLEATTGRLGSEVMVLKTRVGAFEKLAISGSIILNASANGQLSKTTVVKSETLESVQADFKQIKPDFNLASIKLTSPKRRRLKQTKRCISSF